jgi:hypothetical protein
MEEKVKIIRILAILAMLIGVGSIAVGGIFIQQSFWVKDTLMNAIKMQRISSSGVQVQFILDESKLNDPPTRTETPPATVAGATPSPTVIVLPPGAPKELTTKIVGIIDTPEEVKMMADTLTSHLIVGYPPYSTTKNTDPARQTIINGLAMATALNLAQMGLGVSTIALGVGCFMIVTGLGLMMTSFGIYKLSGKPNGV